MQKVIITGAKGMLGQEIVRVFSADPLWNVVAWDMENLDITDANKVRALLTAAEPQLVINCAAYNNVDKAELEPERAMQLNADAVRNLAEVTTSIGATLVHFSTDYVFDGTQQTGYMEAAAPSPQSAYARSKLQGEVHAAQNPKHYVVRLSRLFGKPAASANAKQSFVDTMLSLATERPNLEVVDAEYSSPTYAPDLAQATYDIIRLQSPFGVYHRTNDGACTWYAFAQEIFRIAGKTTPLTPVPPERFPRPAARPAYSQLLTTKLPPLRSWQAALEEYLHAQNT
ncbi:MAG: dTDP-4-dehydrorhamnose reductase [Patescibacteria group bacterium]